MSWSVHHVTHRVKKYLARRYGLVHIKRMAFVIALTSCLLLGSILLFSLFGQALHTSVGLTYTQINVIVSLSAAGMYLLLPALGYLADSYGPAVLSLILIWAFCPAYFVNAMLVRNSDSRLAALEVSTAKVVVMAVSFCFIGLATSSLYFASLVTCARIYPNHKSLAISLPVSCYGLSSLIGAQVLKLAYFHRLPHELDLYRVFSFFLGLYLVVGALNFVSNCVVSIEQEVIFGDREPLLVSSEESSENGDTLTPQRSVVEPVHHHERYIAFLKDKSAWLLLVAIMLSIGPLESFQNNLGLIIDSTTNGSVYLSDQVSIIAALSTAIRLVVGIVADYLSSPERTVPVCKVWLVVVLVAIGAVGQVSANHGVDFTGISVMSGISYGGIFAAYPTVVASVWGVDMMGSTWGSFMVAPAIGSIAFSLLHGYMMDVCPAGASGCLTGYFNAAGGSLVLSVVFLLYVWRAVWCKRGLVCF